MADQKTKEVVEIEAAIDRVDDMRWWKSRLNITGWIVYFMGGLLWILDRPGGGWILLMALAILVFNATVIEYQLSKRRYFAHKLLNAFNRTRAVPFYHELLEKFADNPNLHIHLAADGTIQITDRSKKEIKK